MFPVVRLHSRMRLRTLSPYRAEIHRSTGSAESNDLRPLILPALWTEESLGFDRGQGNSSYPLSLSCLHFHNDSGFAQGRDLGFGPKSSNHSYDRQGISL
jgi:hypothetical protein